MPAPLFFIRKIDDYIIKYPHEQNDGEVDVTETISVDDSLGPIEAETLASTIPAFDLVSQMVQKEIGFEDDAAKENAPEPVAADAPQGGEAPSSGGQTTEPTEPVSYTHLEVYKGQHIL